MLKMSADSLAALKDSGKEDEFKSVLKAAQWGTWVVNIQCKSREYQGNRQMRYTVQQVRMVMVAEHSIALSFQAH